MSEEKKSPPAKVEAKASSSEAKASSSEAKPSVKEAPVKASQGSESRNGKGSGPRNIFSEDFRKNFDSIDWSK
jgi:hypothetical protein